MRLFIVPLILVGLLVQVPTTALGNTNQEAAEKIAGIIGEQFPDADIDVAYRGGKVWLKGEAGSPIQRDKIVAQVYRISGIPITDVSNEIQVVAAKVPAKVSAQTAPLVASAVAAPAPTPNTANQLNAANQRAVTAANNARQVQPQRTQQAQRTQQPQAQQQAARQQIPPPQTLPRTLLATLPQQQYPAAYGVPPGQQQAMASIPFTQTSYVQQPQVPQQPLPQNAQYHPAYYGPPAQAAYHPEAYGPQGPLPGQYNQPHLPDYAWPAYANYPNSAQISYPRQYSPKAWPYIGPFYPYPQVPLGWRKVTLEHNNGWWWLDFDDGAPSGPFSGLFRQPMQYTY